MTKPISQLKWTRQAVRTLNVAAIQAGLLPQGTELKLQKGSRVNGVTVGVTAYDATTGDRLPQQPGFIPTFLLRDTLRDAERLLNATTAGIQALHNKQLDDDLAKLREGREL